MTHSIENGRIDTVESLKKRISELEDIVEKLNSAVSPSNPGNKIKQEGSNPDISGLLNVTLTLLETVDKRKTLQNLIEGVIHLTGLDTGALYSITGEELFLESTVPPLDADFPVEFRHAELQNHHHIFKAVREKTPLLIEDLRKTDISAGEKLIVGSRNMVSLLFIPLLSMQKVIGVLILGTIDRTYEFTQREIDLSQTISNIGSLALENSILLELLNNRMQELKSAVINKEQAEEKLKLLIRAVEHSPVSIVVTDPTGNIFYVNPKFSETTGYSSSEAIGNNPRILKSDYHPADFYKNLWDTIISGRNWYGEMKNKKKNGDYCWENVLISPITDDQGRITHFVGVKEDITEKKEILEKLIKAKEAAEESDRLKTAFLHNISHEIRTPLNAIVGFSSFLNDPELSDEKRKLYSDVINASNDQLLSIIDGIMRLSHLETGQVSINEAGTDIKKLTENLFNQFQPAASEKKLGFTLNNEALDEGTIVLTDEGKLKQILSNLLENAFKFTSSGYVEFGYHIKEKSLEFFVRDTGIGIPDDEHEKIFNRFYQVDKSKSQIYGGTGLGLSICAGYAGLLGGDIKVISKPGYGSVFTLILPYRVIRK